MSEQNTELKKYLDSYYTEKGLKALRGRLKSLTELYVKNLKYPYQAKMFGFLSCKIMSKAHHEGMMDELAQQLGVKEIEIEVNKK